MRLKLHYVLQNIKQHLGRRLIRIDAVNQFLSVVIKHWLALAFVRLLTVSNDINVGVIEPILLKRAALQPLNQFIYLGATKVEDRDYIQCFLEHFSLACIAGNTIQNKRICLGMEPASSCAVMNKLTPKVDGRFVRNEFALA